MWWRRKGIEQPAYPDGRAHIDQPIGLLLALEVVGQFYAEEEGAA